jgi:alkanesulfonate monooxygenase SsuD/methylene tetrahydromethanopterin reductase-like flavin-dependent oxidoreductase (luciferase family)
VITWYPTGQVLRNLFDAYREERALAGETLALGERCAVLRLCFVAETDEEARRVTEPAINAFFKFICKVRGIGVWLDAGEDPNDPRYAEMDPWDLLMQRDNIFIGSPDSVTERMARMTDSHGIQNWLVQMGIPGISNDDVDRSLELFGREVMPALRQKSVTASSSR